MTNNVTFHIVLSNIPQSKVGEENAFLKVIQKEYSELKQEIKDYYKRYDQENTEISKDEIDQITYNPLKYYLFGTYDAAFISIVDRFKFSQRIFSPRGQGDVQDLSFLTNSFQIISGITLSKIQTNQRIKEIFGEKDSGDKKTLAIPPFIGICNIKLNNSLIIGSGDKFIVKVTAEIEDIIKKTVGVKDIYVLIQSFSWFEITVLLFVEEIDLIAEVLFKLRKIQLYQIDKDYVLCNSSLYKNVPENFVPKTREEILHSHVVIDSHTYIGVLSEYISNDKLFELLKLKKFEKVRSEIEWHVKPGHLYNLIESLQKSNALKDAFNLENVSLMVGKSDYLISTNGFNSFLVNLEVFRLLVKPNDFFNNIRKVKSRLFFNKINLLDDETVQRHTKGVTGFVSELNNLGVSIATISRINKKLKALKVSRQIRAKLIKTFYNYNNAIQNPILYTFFLDFGHFVFNLILTIEELYKKFNATRTKGHLYEDLNIQDIETGLFKLLDIFQEGFNIRILNCYQYEDITDFDLDFNSSIEQLLSTYNSIVIVVGDNLYNGGIGKPIYGPIVRLNLKNTVSNYDSINYNVYNFLAPEFVFFTLLKEVLNHFSYSDNSRLNDYINETKELFYKSVRKDVYLADFFVSNSIDFDYYYIDSLRYILVCNHNFGMFTYWFWSTNLQNASMYDAIGVMREKHFKTELFRLCFLAKLFDEEILSNECPIPELENYWERYFDKISKSINYLFEDVVLITKIREIIFEHVGNALNKLGHLKIKEDENMSPGANESEKRIYELLSRIESDVKIYNVKSEFSEGDKYRSLRQDLLPRYSVFLNHFLNANMNKLIEGEAPVFEKSTGLNYCTYLYGLMFTYLNCLYLENNGKINFLRRNWSNGEPLKSFINISDEDALYFVDQTGGIFFAKKDKANKYFVMRNGVLKALWDFASQYKIILFQEINNRAKFQKGKDVSE